MKNDNSKGRIAATNVYNSDHDVTFAIEHTKNSFYKVQTYYDGKPFGQDEIELNLAEAYQVLGDVVRESIANGFTFEK